MDRIAIEDLHLRYFHALDAGDYSLMATAFTEDVRVSISLGAGSNAGVNGMATTVFTSRESMIASLQQGETRLRLTGGAPVKLMTHFLGNLRLVRLDRDSAATETYVLAHLVYERRGRDR